MKKENEIVIVLHLQEDESQDNVTKIGLMLGKAVESAMREHLPDRVGEVTVSARRGLSLT